MARERGQAFVEYVVLLTFVAVVLALAYTLFAGDIAAAVGVFVSRILGA
jgi:Flp pilus assembly pilin Flp